MTCFFCDETAVFFKVYFLQFSFVLIYFSPIIAMISAFSLVSGHFLRARGTFSDMSVRVGFYCSLGVAVAFVQHAVAGIFAELITPIITVVAVLSQTLGKMKSDLEPPVNEPASFVAAGGAILCFLVAFAYFKMTIEGLNPS